jgi:hypothetical protein
MNVCYEGSKARRNTKEFAEGIATNSRMCEYFFVGNDWRVGFTAEKRVKGC